MPKLNPELYGGDPTGLADSISSRGLGVRPPTLDINGEKDERADPKGNFDSGRTGQDGSPSTDGGTGG